MAAWAVSTFLLAVAAGSVFADPRLTFPENVQGRGSRIVSGWEAEEAQIPYQLSLRMVNQIGGVSACGATIIHPEWAMTAAHCTAGRITVVIRMGTVNLTRPEGIFETTTYYNHPLYNEALQSVVQPHDIGVIKFNRIIQFSEKVQPVRLQPSSDKDLSYDLVKFQASGWGRTWTGGLSPENLNWVYLLGVTNSFCRAAFGNSAIIVDSTICARGYNVTSQSTCQGDSGGPLVFEDFDGQPTQVGISSFVSSSGCHTDFPAGFIRPGHYHDWLTKVTGVNFDWEREPTTTPKPEATTAEPETEATTAKPEPEATTAEPEPEATTATPEPEATTAEPEPEATTAEPEPEATTSEPESEETTDSQEPTSIYSPKTGYFFGIRF